MNLSAAVFVCSFLSLVYFFREVIRSFRSPEFRRELARMRENRRLRKAARR
jgi:hypothetical protein